MTSEGETINMTILYSYYYECDLCLCGHLINIILWISRLCDKCRRAVMDTITLNNKCMYDFTLQRFIDSSEGTIEVFTTDMTSIWTTKYILEKL